VNVVVAGPLAQPLRREPTAVRRESGWNRHSAGREYRLLRARAQISDEDVEVDAVSPVAGVGEQAAVRILMRLDMHELGLVDERSGSSAAGRVDQVELVALVATLVLLDQDAAVLEETRGSNRVLEIGQWTRLPPVAGTRQAWIVPLKFESTSTVCSSGEMSAGVAERASRSAGSETVAVAEFTLRARTRAGEVKASKEPAPSAGS
jgi:hypothetical protein